MSQPSNIPKSLYKKIDNILAESLSSSPSTPMTEKDWKRIRTKGQKLAKTLRRK